MRLFRYLRNRRPVETGETPLQRFCRYLIVIALFAAVVWGFSENNKRQLNLLKKNTRQVPVEPLVEKPFPFDQYPPVPAGQAVPVSPAAPAGAANPASPAVPASQAASPVAPAGAAKPASQAVSPAVPANPAP